MPPTARLCQGLPGRKCNKWMSSLEKDPHPTCVSCRGKTSPCIRLSPCDVCVKWTPEQWVLYEGKRSYHRKVVSTPSVSVGTTSTADVPPQLASDWSSIGLGVGVGQPTVADSGVGVSNQIGLFKSDDGQININHPPGFSCGMSSLPLSSTTSCVTVVGGRTMAYVGPSGVVASGMVNVHAGSAMATAPISATVALRTQNTAPYTASHSFSHGSMASRGAMAMASHGPMAVASHGPMARPMASANHAHSAFIPTWGYPMYPQAPYMAPVWPQHGYGPQFGLGGFGGAPSVHPTGVQRLSQADPSLSHLPPFPPVLPPVTTSPVSSESSGFSGFLPMLEDVPRSPLSDNAMLELLDMNVSEANVPPVSVFSSSVDSMGPMHGSMSVTSSSAVETSSLSHGHTRLHVTADAPSHDLQPHHSNQIGGVQVHGSSQHRDSHAMHGLQRRYEPPVVDISDDESRGHGSVPPGPSNCHATPTNSDDHVSVSSSLLQPSLSTAEMLEYLQITAPGRGDSAKPSAALGSASTAAQGSSSRKSPSPKKKSSSSSSSSSKKKKSSRSSEDKGRSVTSPPAKKKSSSPVMDAEQQKSSLAPSSVVKRKSPEPVIPKRKKESSSSSSSSSVKKTERPSTSESSSSGKKDSKRGSHSSSSSSSPVIGKKRVEF